MEFVLVVPRDELFPCSYPHGLVRFAEEAAPAAAEAAGKAVPGVCMAAPTSSAAVRDVVARSGFFVERELAERTPAWKQPIPYAIVTGPEGVFLVRRLDGVGESRLAGKLSIGLGGHVDPGDAEDLTLQARRTEAGVDLLARATARELAEELAIEGEYDVRTVGLLNDDTNPVGAVHVGVVQVVTVHGTVTVREEQQLEGGFVTPPRLASLLAEGADFESWSALLIPHLAELLQSSTSAHLVSSP